jgi:hypothetical protein
MIAVSFSIGILARTPFFGLLPRETSFNIDSLKCMKTERLVYRMPKY